MLCKERFNLALNSLYVSLALTVTTFCWMPVNVTITSVAKIPMTTITIKSSTIVKPFYFSVKP